MRHKALSETVRIVPELDLTAHNTFGLKSRAAYGARITSPDQIVALRAFAAEQRLPLAVIGGGSNVLLREEIDSVVALMATKGRSILGLDKDRVLVRAMAGEDWPDLVAWLVGQGIGGLENLSGIPGTVGAAPVQNISAYGVELAERFHSLTTYDRVEDVLVTLDRDACGFGYRHSIFKATDRYVILDVTLSLPQPWKPVIGYKGLETLSGRPDADAVMKRVFELRREKLPDWRLIGNAGSFFHNPVVAASVAARIPDAPRYPQGDGRIKLAAGWLIEMCGLKAAREGSAGVHDDHALILVNHGGATFSDVARMAARVREAVHARFGIELVQEPRTI